jgi:hypothetical protein
LSESKSWGAAGGGTGFETIEALESVEVKDWDGWELRVSLSEQSGEVRGRPAKGRSGRGRAGDRRSISPENRARDGRRK